MRLKIAIPALGIADASLAMTIGIGAKSRLARRDHRPQFRYIFVEALWKQEGAKRCEKLAVREKET